MPMVENPRNADTPKDRETGPPGARPRGRGSERDNPKADSVMPGREAGAGGQVDDGPDVTSGNPTGHSGG